MITELIGKRILFLDGGMGSMLQKKGLGAGQLPEIWNITKPEAITGIHKSYFDAGSDIVLTNTFGANSLHYHDGEYSVKDIITAAVYNANERGAMRHRRQEQICRTRYRPSGNS